MIKVLLAAMSALLLSGCVAMNMDSSNYAYVPYIKTFQKKDTIGHTNTEQRKKDLYSCGVEKNVNLDDGTWSRGGSNPNETLQQSVLRAEQLESCMKSKGYVVYGFDECGPLKAPTGLCN
jgi:hypothetical protein